MARSPKAAEPVKKKEAVKKAEKPAAKTRKLPVRRSAAKKTAAPQVTLTLQYMGKELTQDDMVAAVKSQCAQLDIKDLKLYLKPEDQAIYFVVNDNEYSGKVEL